MLKQQLTSILSNDKGVGGVLRPVTASTGNGHSHAIETEQLVVLSFLRSAGEILDGIFNGAEGYLTTTTLNETLQRAIWAGEHVILRTGRKRGVLAEGAQASVRSL